MHAAPFVIRSTFFLITVSLAMCIGAHTVGAMIGLPDPIRRQGFAPCPAPCLMNTMPGITSWEHVQTRFASAQRATPSIVLTLPSSAEITFHRSIDAHHLGRIHYWSPQPPFSLGWVITLYGQPCATTLYPNARQVTIRYPSLLINLDVTNGLNAHSIPSTLDYTDPAFKPDFQPDLCIDNVTGNGAINLRWQGLGHLRRILHVFS
jgi:hypothetical protein